MGEVQKKQCLARCALYLDEEEVEQKLRGKWSWREESNPRPADYKSAALPTELRQLKADRNDRQSG